MNTLDQSKHAPPGQMVDIGGFQLHAVVRGQGSPTVLFEPALGGFALQYARIQTAAATFTRAMAYDRAGQGWSETSPNPRTPLYLAAELKALLGRLDLHPPFILVGHSFGGLLARTYAGYHPGDVAGIILVDSSHENQHDSSTTLDKMLRQAAMGVHLQKIVSRLGLGKLLTKISLGSAANTLPREDLNAFLEIASRPKHQETMLAEFSQHRFYFGAQSEVPLTVGDTPLIVVTAGQSVSGQKKIGGKTGDEVNALHQRLQKELVLLSSQSEQVIIPDATHLSILSEPGHVAVVVDAIQGMVERVRKMAEREPHTDLPGGQGTDEAATTKQTIDPIQP